MKKKKSPKKSPKKTKKGVKKPKIKEIHDAKGKEETLEDQLGEEIPQKLTTSKISSMVLREEGGKQETTILEDLAPETTKENEPPRQLDYTPDTSKQDYKIAAPQHEERTINIRNDQASQRISQEIQPFAVTQPNLQIGFHNEIDDITRQAHGQSQGNEEYTAEVKSADSQTFSPESDRKYDEP